MDSFLHKPCVASDFAPDDFNKINHWCGYINNDDDDDDSLLLTSFQCEQKRANENKMVDSTLAFFGTTQHTLSTFCSTEGYDDDDISGCWNDDEISLESFNDGYQSFDLQPLLGLVDNVDSIEPTPYENMICNNARIAQPTFITFNNSTVKGNNQENFNENIEHSDDRASFHNSQESLFGAANRGSFHDQQREGSTKQGFNDSMTSLSEAFEKLDYCMLRTAQSRKLVRQLTEKLALSSSQATLPCGPLTTASTAATKITSTNCSILRSNSSGSLTCSSSVSSRNHRKGPKSFHKGRRHVNKATLSNKTGVAIRTLLNASFS